MKHSVIFNNSSNKWDNALPLGNGSFGAMLYFDKNKLHMPMNHYEIYYNISKYVLPKDKLSVYKPSEHPGKTHEDALMTAKSNAPSGNEPHVNYMTSKSAVFDKNAYGIMKFSGSYPSTGNIEFDFDDFLSDAEQSLILYVEDAKVVLSLEKEKEKINIDTIVAREDLIINHVSQSKPGLLKSIHIAFPPYRDFKYPEITYRQIDEHTFSYTVTQLLGKYAYPSDDETTKPFVYSGIIRLCGCSGKILKEKFGSEIILSGTNEEFHIITAIFTDWRYKNTVSEGLTATDKYSDNISAIYNDHKKYWKDFFDRSSVSLPDKFLEHVYYVNQYALDCCSGKDGIMKHHACGLNGLWDVRHPNLWGSMWYWDVNIQAAFAGVFSSNRLDLAKVFSDGLLSYVELAKKSARDHHNVSGIAGDYPYTFYYSCWPWCAQYLWFLYEYSLDKDYLKNEAYPVFLGLCEFFLNIFKYDEKRGYYSVYPDISPEQGPYAHDTTITVACVKYLFKITIEASKILGISDDIIKKCQTVVKNMAPYAFSKDGTYGVHLKDSPDAPDNMWLRHPSLLMPLFPIGEYDINSDKKITQILSNTIDYLEDRAETGIFGGSWLAAAAARLGRGQTALRLIYEKGIDHMLRSNGLTAEETERFINFCLVPRQPIYYPCMMEFTGEMLAAVNEMLLQSHNNIIRVFPALPDGDREYERSKRHGYSLNEYIDRFTEYPAWENIRFDKLLAKGAFEVTAELKDRKIKFILIHSKKGGKVNITSIFADPDLSVFCEGKKIQYKKTGDVFTFDTIQKKQYLIAKSADICTRSDEYSGYSKDVLTHETYTKRNICIGETPETNYQKAVDGFIRDWYLGNVRMENHTVYKFDFTENSDKKYAECLPRQAFCAEERVIRSMTFNTFDKNNLAFTYEQGFGFSDISDIKMVKRTAPDILRCDFAEGSKDTEFLIDAPRGQYELFVVSGDADEENITILEAAGGRKTGGEIIKRGRFQCKLIPLVNEDDELIRLKISAKKGFKWKINFIMLNAVKGY